MTFKVGDRVLTTRQDYGHREGEYGTIVRVGADSVGVRFDTYWARRHGLSSTVPDGHGWNCDPEYLQEPQNTSVNKRREW